MAFEKTYNPKSIEQQLRAYWLVNGVYNFNFEGAGEIFSIDTPPPTVSGFLHLGHVYSYSHTDFVARFRRMNGWRVFYPMGFDDNGLPTERFLEKTYDLHARDLDQQAYIGKCLSLSQDAEREYISLWKRLGLSVDWNYTYRTIDTESRRISQWSFIDLYQRGMVERRMAPGIWCPECQASFAQADLNDEDRESKFITLKFKSSDGQELPIATTRPEMLAACVAVFIHPKDERLAGWIGREVIVPEYGQQVSVISDMAVDPSKGTGAVMCCTFGDRDDVGWWFAHNLDTVELITPDGRMGISAGPIAGMTIKEARKNILEILRDKELVLEEQSIAQTIRVHERCDTPVEYRMLNQWFVNILDHKQKLLALGEKITWYPSYMHARYRSWVENLSWDWCLSRQRSFGVPFPVWYCQDCGEILLPERDSLPVNPQNQTLSTCHACGGSNILPEEDVMDTWATSSMSPQIVGGWGENSNLYDQVFPFSIRPQAHDIIRTWVFYTIVKSYLHFRCLPWKEVVISGWGIAGEGEGKISKSRGGGSMPPKNMIERYSADAVRYWAASTGPGKDAVISEEKIKNGQKLVKKLWNVARFTDRFLDRVTGEEDWENVRLTGGDRWILARLQQVIAATTNQLMVYDYAAAKNEIETFFWQDLTDNYLEMCKQRLYDSKNPTHGGAVRTLCEILKTILKLLAPFLPFVTEKIYLTLFAQQDDTNSIHLSPWPEPEAALIDPEAEAFGSTLVGIAHAVRRYKSRENLSLGHPIFQLQLATVSPNTTNWLKISVEDIKSITRAETIEMVDQLERDLVPVDQLDGITVGLTLSFQAAN